METIQTLLLVLQVLVSVALIGFILIQHGKGADAGAAFGSGASATVFGSRGSGNFLTKTTAVLAIIFLANSLFLSYLSTQRVKAPASLLDSEPAVVLPQLDDKPAVDAPVQDAASDIPQDIQEEEPVGIPQDMPPDVPVEVPAETSEAPVIDIPAIPE